MAANSRRTLRTMCPMNCHPTYCGMVVEIEDDRVLQITGDHENPDSRGFLCVRGHAAAEIVDNPKRILAPRARERRDPDAWRDVTWETALDRIAGRVRAEGPSRTAVWAGHGVFTNGLGGPLSARFANLVGAQWWQPSIVCWGLGGFGFSLTGVTEVNSMEDMAEHAELILLWGANLASQPTTAPRIVAARRRGARVVAIDVRRSEAFAQADETYLVRPGSDAALALAMMNVIIGEGLHDAGFVARHTVGFEQLAEHVQRHSPQWAERETGVEAEHIRGLARTFASTRKATILAGGSSMHKTGNVWHAARAIACLPALTGSLGSAGAGMGPRHSARSHGMGLNSIVPPDPKAPEDTVISEMSTILKALEAGRIQVLILLGTNMLSSFADSSRVERALERMNLVVSFDMFMNETARGYADVFLPGTSWLEETGFKATNSHLYLMDRGLEPRGDSRPAWWLLEQLARRLGVDDFFPWTSVDGVLDTLFDHDATRHTTVADLRSGEAPRVALAVSEVGHPDLEFPTPSGKVELVSEAAARLGLPALPVYEPAHENHPASASARRFPLTFVQGRSITHFHAFYDHGRALPSLARADPEPRLWISPTDAAGRGLQDGDEVRIHNDRGEMAALARVTDRVPEGVVWMRDGWEGLNRLTSGERSVPDAAALSFPAGAASYQARVEVSAAR